MVRVKGVHGPRTLDVILVRRTMRTNRLAPVRTQVGIVGAGPAGLTLAMLLHREGIDCVVLEARDRGYVEKRVRAGLLEQNTVDLLRELGVAERLDREGLEHNGIYLRYREENHYVDMAALTGRHITIYGQQEVVKDLTQALLDRGVPVLFEVSRRRAPRHRDRHAADHLRARRAPRTSSSATRSRDATASTASAARRSPST